MSTVDIEQLLKRVVREVFGSTADVTYTCDPKYSHGWSAALVAVSDRSKAISIHATYEWSSAHIDELDVGTIVFEYEDDEGEKESSLRGLALMARAYLEGHGAVEMTPRRFGRSDRASVTIDADGCRWVLRKRSSSIERL